MKPPTIVKEIDYLVLESTYGNRLHEKVHPKDLLKEVINKTIQRGGTIVIPAFAVGRTQSLLYYILLLKKEKSIPNIPIYLDSPMAINATDILCKYNDEHYLSEETCAELSDNVTYTRKADESKELDLDPQPKIIISASGMATGGRILFHLKTYAGDPKNTILFSGYQADGTRGADMLNGKKEIKIHGELVPIRAELASLSNASAHADCEETLQWLSHFRKPPIKTFITHGEPKAAMALKNMIEEKLRWKCVVPYYQQKVNLG